MALNLDVVLNKRRMVRKAYHGRSFVGNHCKKNLQPQMFGDITSSVPKTALQLVSHHEILTKVEIIHQKFGQLFELFSTVDGLLSHDLPVAETTIPKTDKAISEYTKFIAGISLEKTRYQNNTFWNITVLLRSTLGALECL